MKKRERKERIRNTAKKDAQLSTKRISLLFLRYIIILLVSIKNLWIFYFVLSPITIHASNLLLKTVFRTSLIGNSIIIKAYEININNACVAGAAYYLLFILIFSIPLNAKKRIKAVLFSFISLLVLNILRIFILGILFVNNVSSFDATHKIFWYFLSSIFIATIWIATVKIFKIKEVPFYTDIKYLFSIRRFENLHK
jgi:exosortase/archaeosortase family protein